MKKKIFAVILTLAMVLTMMPVVVFAESEVNVTFDPNYEGAESTTKEQVVGTTYKLPEPPTRENYDFAGWFTDKQAGTQVTSTTEVEITTDHTLYAHWNFSSAISIDKIADQTYTGEEIKPDITVKDAAGNTVASDNYTATYTDNINAGTATVKVTGLKDYTGLTATQNFTITRAPVTVKAKDASKEYGAADPAFEAEVSGTVGTDTVEYTVSRGAGEDAGVYTITPMGGYIQGNYSVSYVYGTFTINPAQGSDVKTDTEALTKIQNAYKEKYKSENVSVGMRISDEKVDEDEMALIKAKAGSKKLNGINIELVVNVDGDVIKDAGSKNDVLISTEFKFDLSGKTDIQVLRVHDGELDELTETPNTDGEYIVLDKEAGSITVTAKKYSTYAVAYNEEEEPEPTTTASGTEYPVTFDSMGGTAVAGQHHAKGEKLVKPADPTKSGYTFAGWYMEKNYNQAWNFNLYTVSGPTTLYAKWTAAGAGGSSTPNTTDGNTAWPYVMAGLAAAAAIAFAAARKRRMQ